MIGAILGDLAPSRQRRCLLLVNGFGGTPAMELYLMSTRRAALLAGRGLTVARSLVGNYVTSLEMAGCSITVTLLDEAYRALGRAGAHGRAALGRMSTIQHAVLQPPEREAAMRGLCVGFLGNTLMFSSWNWRVPCRKGLQFIRPLSA